MDPTTAVGLAVNIAQLIELSWKLVSKTRTIREQGRLPELRDAQIVTADLRASNSRLLTYLDKASANQAGDEDDEALRYLSVCSSDVSEELLQHLDRIVSGGRKYKSIRQALKAYYKREQLASLSVRLQEYRTQLNTRLLLSVRQKFDSLTLLEPQHLAGLEQATQEITELLHKREAASDAKMTSQTQDLTQVIITYSEQIQTGLRDINNLLTKPAVSVSPHANPSQLFDAITRRDTNVLDRALANDPTLLTNPSDSDNTLLHHAARQGNVEMVRYFLANGAESRIRDSAGMAAQDYLDPESLLHWFLHHGPSLETRNSHLSTALGYFSREGDLKAVTMLLNLGAEVDASGHCERTPLMEASDAGRTLVVKTLLQFGADVNHANRRKETSLLLAASHGHTSIGEILLGAGANVNAQDSSGRTSLTLCCWRGHLDMAHMLLRYDADPNLVSVKGNEPLFMAAQKGNLKLARDLLETGANVNLTSASSGKTALSEACERGHVSLVELLLAHHCKCNTHTYDSGYSPLMFAAGKGVTATIALLLERGDADINAADFNNRTALYHAVWRDHPDAVATLLNAGADVSIAGYDAEFPDISYSPICRASFGNNRSEVIVRHLLAAGADAKDSNNGGMSALMEASRFNHLGIVQCLVEAGANVNHVAPTDGQTALSEACIKGWHDIAAHLLDRGANVNFRNRDRQTSLHRAAIENRPWIVHLLSRVEGVDMNGKDRTGKTPLFEAADRGHLEVCEILLANGADANCRDTRNYTPLCMAAWKGHTKIVRILIDTGGADVDAANWRSMTPLGEAAKHGRADIVQALLERGANRELVCDDGNLSPIQHAERTGHPKAQQIIWMLREYFPT